MFIIYDWEKNIIKELNEKSLLLVSGETKLQSCVLTDSQIISIKITPEKEVILLPKFLI